MTFTFIIVLFCTVRSFLRSKSAPASFAFCLSMVFGALIPIQFTAKYNLEVDFFTAISILIVYLFSSVNLRTAGNILDVKNFSGALRVRGLVAAIILFPLPAIFTGLFPIITAVSDGLFSANLQREVLTKEMVWAQMYITLIFRLGFMLSAFSCGVNFSNGTRNRKLIFVLTLLVACAVSILYVQKANPLFLVMSFFLGRILSGSTNLSSLLMLVGTSSALILGIGIIVVGPSLTYVFFLDMLTRRMTDVPYESLAAHFDFYNEHGIQLLRHNFTFLTGNMALPRLIYATGGGGLQFGWSNSLYVGDLVVNFGHFGMMPLSVLLGFIVRLGNKAAAGASQYWQGRNFALFGIAAFIFSLSNNAFFSGVQFVLLFVFLLQYGVIGRASRIAATKKAKQAQQRYTMQRKFTQ